MVSFNALQIFAQKLKTKSEGRFESCSTTNMNSTHAALRSVVRECALADSGAGTSDLRRRCADLVTTHVCASSEALSSVSAREPSDVPDSALALVSALHPMLQTLVLGVADVYKQRLRVLVRVMQAEAREQLAVTLQQLQAAEDIQRYALACGESCVQRLRADVDERFEREHAKTLVQCFGHQPHAAAAESLQARLERSIARQCVGAASALCPPPRLPLPLLPEPVPWKLLEQRVAQWKEQARKTREVMQASTQGAVDGMRLSKALGALAPSHASATDSGRDSSRDSSRDSGQLGGRDSGRDSAQHSAHHDAQHSEEDASLEDWHTLLLHEAQQAAARERLALRDAGTSRAAVLLARLRSEYAQAAQTAHHVQSLVARAARQHLQRHMEALEQWERHYVRRLSQRRQRALQASVLAEQALQHELETATASNAYMWRAVQRAVQGISESFHTGLRAAQASTAAAAQRALDKALEAPSRSPDA